MPMSRVSLMLSLAIAAASPTAAQQRAPASALATCAGIEGSAPRLACYDSLAGRRAAPAQRPTVPGLGRWVVNDTTNPLNDTRKVSLFLEASSGRSPYGRPVGLVLRCQDSKTEVFVAWNAFISDDEGDVTMRVGTDEAETANWSKSSDNEATFYPGDAPQLIQRLITANRLVLQTTPYQESPITAIFDLAGLANAVKPLRAACGW